MKTREYNFDGLIGPTHNYAGLSFGNLASTAHQNQPSHPRAAARQGLAKMRTLMELGVGQCVLPPLRRPRLELLRALGFSGATDADLIQVVAKNAPQLLAASYSAASMWTANAATVSPSADCADGRLHFTPANLASTLHRSIEAPSTTQLLRAIFADDNHFVVHNPLPSSAMLLDEGAANHTRLVDACGNRGIEFFVYGRDNRSTGTLVRSHRNDGQECPSYEGTSRFPARQSHLASQAVVRRHQLDPEFVLLCQQNPIAIDAGVFHNDVISVGHQNVLLCHELAFVNQSRLLTDLKLKFQNQFGQPLQVFEFSDAEFPLTDAVRSYLFNSQLVTRPDGKMTLVCPSECAEIETARRCTQRILDESNPVDEVQFLDLRQSMNNGGGPACLRLRVVLTDTEFRKIHQGIVLTEPLAKQLENWINSHYRETLSPQDLADPQLMVESREALESLAVILKLPAELLLG